MGEEGGDEMKGERELDAYKVMQQLRYRVTVLEQEFADFAWRLDEALHRPKTLCVECGPNVSIDEDGCCIACGATATGKWLKKRARNAPKDPA